MLKKMGILLLLSCSLVLGGVAQGHEFIVKPDGSPRVEKGKTYTGQCQAAHIFMESEEAEPLGDIELTVAGDPVKVEVVQGKPWLEYSFTSQSEKPFFVRGWRKPQIWSTTTQGVLEGDKSTLTAQGKTVVSVGKYEKFSKTLYGAPNDYAVFGAQLGQRLEIVPLAESGAVKLGATLRCKVYLDGVPVSLPIQATYDGYSQEEDMYLAVITPDKDGVVAVPVTKNGLWLLRTETTLKNAESGVDTHNLRATLVFEVQ